MARKHTGETPVFQSSRRFRDVFAEQVGRFGLRKTLEWNLYRAANNPLRLLSLAIDRRRDLRVCGVSLVEGKFTEHREDRGATNSVSTPYGALVEVLGQERFTENDAIVDIGCGHGRVLAFLADNGFPGSITGIELDAEVAAFARSWAQRYPNVEVIAGDAFDQDLSRFTVFYFWKPMLANAFKRFIEKLEAEVTHEVRLYYLTDFDTAGYLAGRPGWSELWARSIYRHHGLPQFYSPQNCSAWTFNPQR